MVQRVQVIIEDDYSGGHADQTVAFGLDGRDYEIDLSDPNAANLRESLRPWIVVARRVVRQRRKHRVTAAQEFSSRAIRDWAARKGIKVNERGRIPVVVQEQYKADHTPAAAG